MEYVLFFFILPFQSVVYLQINLIINQNIAQYALQYLFIRSVAI